MIGMKTMRPAVLAAFCLFLCFAAALCAAPRSGLVAANPETAGMDSIMLNHIGAAAAASIKAGEIPGAVVLIARHGRIVYWNAFGNRALEPAPEPMTRDTIFDVASLTKVMATTPSIMLLAERGVLRLDDKVKKYLPEFTGDGKDSITLKHLLTHYSGLRPDFDLAREWFGREAALQELWKEKTATAPGKEFAYSDLNFIALGEVVRVASGKTLEEFASEEIFIPLGMTETGFRPPKEWIPRIAPTETRRNTLKYLRGQATAQDIDRMLRGEVHDPTAWRMGGAAGHAGLFSSAHDIAVYAQTLLTKGAYAGGRLLSEASVRAMTSPQSPEDSTQVRGLGWDLKSAYSSPRGDLWDGGFGHTGFSGASLWVIPAADTFVVILTNRVHPDGGKDINHLRGAIANIAAAAITQ